MIGKSILELKILVAEDDETDLAILRSVIRKIGIANANVVSVTSLQDAILALNKFNYDVILLDLDLEDSKGIDTLKELNEKFPNVAKIILSGHSDTEIPRQTLRLGAQDYIFKDNLKNSHLENKINYAIDRNYLLHQVRENLDFKTRFLAQMSHEIRTPMNGVIGLTEVLLKSEELSQEDRKVVQTISGCGKHLISLISDILDVSKIESKKVDLEISTCNIRKIIDETMNSFTHKAANNQLTLSTLIHPQVPTYIMTDAGRLKQIIFNLVSNAVKYTDKGSVSINVTYEPIRKNLGKIRIDVTDTGRGIDRATRPLLFNEYYQAGMAISNDGIRGTGLGLAICKGLVEKMGGNIGLESTLGKGSVFWFEIELSTRASSNRTRTNLTEKNAIIFSTLSSRAAILKTHLELRQINSTLLPMSLKKLSTEFKNDDFLKSKNVDIVILDSEGYPKTEIKEFINQIQVIPTFENKSILLLSNSAKKLGTLPHNMEKMSGSLSQSKIYSKIAKLLGEKSVEKYQENAPLAIDRRLNDLKVLVVDDNDVNRKVAEKMLHCLGCKFDSVHNGKKATEVAASTKYDVILMDCYMPEMNGFEATKAIRNSISKNKITPIIALTANAFSDCKKECFESGMNDVLSKPILMKDLQSTLQRLRLENNIKPDHIGPNYELEEKNRHLILNKLASLEVLDHPTLSSLKDLEDPEDEVSFLDDLIETFVSQAPPIIKELQLAINTRDKNKTKHFSHKLKGFSRNLGASQLTELFEMLESSTEEIANHSKTLIIKLIDEKYKEAVNQLNSEWKRSA